MEIVFIVYYDIMDDRISKISDCLQIEFYIEWENFNGKGHNRFTFRF